MTEYQEGCIGSSESTLVKMLHCWKSHVAAQLLFVLWEAAYKYLYTQLRKLQLMNSIFRMSMQSKRLEVLMIP